MYFTDYDPNGRAEEFARVEYERLPLKLQTPNGVVTLLHTKQFDPKGSKTLPKDKKGHYVRNNEFINGARQIIKKRNSNPLRND